MKVHRLTAYGDIPVEVEYEGSWVFRVTAKVTPSQKLKMAMGLYKPYGVKSFEETSLPFYEDGLRMKAPDLLEQVCFRMSLSQLRNPHRLDVDDDGTFEEENEFNKFVRSCLAESDGAFSSKEINGCIMNPGPQVPLPKQAEQVLKHCEGLLYRLSLSRIKAEIHHPVGNILHDFNMASLLYGAGRTVSENFLRLLIRKYPNHLESVRVGV